MPSLRLYKREKLCSNKAIEELFSHRAGTAVSSAIAYPLRVSWKMDTQRSVKCPRFLIVVPKRRLRHAVDRVQMRRRIREAYRLNRHLFPSDSPLDIAFVYVADSVKDYHSVTKAMERLLAAINNSLVSNDESAQ